MFVRWVFPWLSVCLRTKWFWVRVQLQSFNANNVAEILTHTKSSNKCHFSIKVTSLASPYLSFLIPKEFFQCPRILRSSFLISALTSTPLHTSLFVRKHLVRSVSVAFKIESAILWYFQHWKCVLPRWVYGTEYWMSIGNVNAPLLNK